MQALEALEMKLTCGDRPMPQIQRSCREAT